jgi:hypothetical protein
MFRPIVCRIVAVVLAAPTLLVATAVAASASEHPASDTHHHVTAGNGWRGHDTLTWYHARTAYAGALGAYTSTVDAAAWSAGDTGRTHRHLPMRQAPKAATTANLMSHRTDNDSSGAAYHQDGAQANAWGASTSRTNAMVRDYGDEGYVWMNQTGATANAWGADAGRTNSFAMWGHDRSAVGYSSSLAHAGYDGASAGDTDSGAVFR